MLNVTSRILIFLTFVANCNESSVFISVFQNSKKIEREQMFVLHWRFMAEISASLLPCFVVLYYLEVTILDLYIS